MILWVVVHSYMAIFKAFHLVGYGATMTADTKAFMGISPLDPMALILGKVSSAPLGDITTTPL